MKKTSAASYSCDDDCGASGSHRQLLRDGHGLGGLYWLDSPSGETNEGEGVAQE